MPAVMPRVITCENVGFRYGEEPVLQGVSFSLEKGAYVGIVGSNGSGKTTLLKILLGLLRPTEGEVKLFGEPIGSFRAWEKIGYVPQNVFRGDLNFPATVREVVESGHLKGERGMLYRIGQEECAAVEEALRRAGISHLLNKRIGDLSGGERQRVFIARALVSDPELLVLDEPTTGIDAATEEHFYAFLETLNREGMTIVLVSHDLEAVARHASSVLCLNRRMVCYGKPEALERPEILKAMYGGSGQVVHHAHDHS